MQVCPDTGCLYLLQKVLSGTGTERGSRYSHLGNKPRQRDKRGRDDCRNNNCSLVQTSPTAIYLNAASPAHRFPNLIYKNLEFLPTERISVLMLNLLGEMHF